MSDILDLQGSISSERVSRMNLVPLGNLIRQAKSGFASGLRSDEGVIQIRMNNVDTRGGLVWDSFIRVPADEKVVNDYRLSPNDVLFNNTNSTALVGKSTLFSGYDEPVVFSNHFTRLRTDTTKLSPSYLAWWLNYEWYRGTFAEICNQWIGQSAVKPDKLLSLCIPLPSIPEQECISAQLTKALAAVEKARFAARDRLVMAHGLQEVYLREMFEGPGTSEWEQVRIGDLTRTCSGATPPRGNSEYYGGDIPWVKTGELKDGFVDEIQECVTKEALRDCSLPLLPEGTLLIAMYGQGKTRGRTGVLARPATTNQACFAILPNRDRFDPIFLQLWFRSKYASLRQLTESRGGNQPNLNGVLLRELNVPVPPVNIQLEIASGLHAKLGQTSDISLKASEELAMIESLPKALLRAAFEQGKPTDG